MTATEVVLFDGSLGTSPGTQGWTLFADPLFTHSVSQAVGVSATTLDTLTPISDRGGYFSEDPLFGLSSHPDMPVIERTPGYTVRFDVRIVAENHATGAMGDDNDDGLDDRSGFSMIVISEDLLGLELALWEDRIWAQEDDSAMASELFTQAEGVAFDTTANQVRYDLVVSGDGYELFADSSNSPILAGPLRSYVNFSRTVDPYEIPSFLFSGDDTTRGETMAEIAYISVTLHDFITGDMDCDGDIDFDDIDDFVLGLNDPVEYEDIYGVAPSVKGDTDGDADLDFDDIPGFVDVLSGSSLQAVPEPTSFILALLAGGLSLALGRRVPITLGR